MRNINVLHAPVPNASGYADKLKREWKVAAGCRQSVLWRYGVGATFTTSSIRQYQRDGSSIRARSISSDSARNIVKCHRKSSTQSSSRGASFGVAEARAYCAILLRKHDSATFTLQTFIPGPARDAYLALRAFNIEIARVPDVTSNPTIGAMRLQFWRDAVRRALSSGNTRQQQDGHNSNDNNDTTRLNANAEPVAILLSSAIVGLRARTQSTSSPSLELSSRNNVYSPTQDPTRTWYPWLNRMITAREQYLDNRPYPTLEALEAYAEDTYSVLMYLCLSALPVASVEIDHVASHIGKAMGIATVLRGLPFLAFPTGSAGPAAWPLTSISQPSSSPTTTTSPSSSSASASASFPSPAAQITTDDQQLNDASLPFDTNNPRSQHQGTVPLPLDILSSTNVREEDIFRCGSSAPNLRDAVFKVASRAHEHLITAHEMLESIRSNNSLPTATASTTSISSADSKSHATANSQSPDSSTDSSHAGLSGPTKSDIDRAFGVLIQAVPTHLWLEKLQRVDFDIFDPRVRRQDWRLPWKAYWAYRRGRLMDA